MPRLRSDAIVPAAINNLKLCPALSNCGSLGVAACFDKSTADRLYAFDDSSLGYSDWNDCYSAVDVAKTFLAKNPNNSEIALLPLDNRIVNDGSVTAGGITDCALLTQNELSFVEFKTNAASAKSKNLRKNAKKAIKQLWHTYDGIISPRCASEGISIPNLVDVDFYIVFDSALNVTNAMAEFQAMMADFLKTNGFPLYFENEKEFL